MADKPTQPFQTPSGKKQVQSSSRIFTMPKEYRGLAAHQTPASLHKPAPMQVAPKPPVKKPPVSTLKKPPIKKKKMSRTRKTILVAGAVIILGLIAVAIYVLVATSSTPSLPETPTPTPPVVVQPTPTPPPVIKEPVEKEVEKDEEPSSPFPDELRPGRDSDSDGLTDLEEQLYGTNNRLPDTDADGFLDGNEVYNRYHPNAPAPHTLLDSGAVKIFTIGEVFTIFYPSTWTPQSVPGESVAAVFAALTGETITISAEPKSPAVSLSDWYVAQGPSSTLAEVQESTTKNGYEMLMTNDEMIAFVDAGGYAIRINYHVIGKQTVDYLQTFQMMLNSVDVLLAQLPVRSPTDEIPVPPAAADTTEEELTVESAAAEDLTDSAL